MIVQWIYIFALKLTFFFFCSPQIRIYTRILNRDYPSPNYVCMYVGGQTKVTFLIRILNLTVAIKTRLRSDNISNAPTSLAGENQEGREKPRRTKRKVKKKINNTNDELSMKSHQVWPKPDYTAAKDKVQALGCIKNQRALRRK